MKFKIKIALTFLAAGIFSCSQRKNYSEPVAEPAAIVKDIMSFLKYREKYIKLYEPFTGLDSASNSIPKEKFLRLLSTGNYLPLKLISSDAAVYYKLDKLDNSVDNDITTTIRDWGLEEYDYYKLEGTYFPDFRFVDMNGKTYDKGSTKGKVIVIKCWFIDCLPCVQEIPALNKLRQQYLNQNDVLFISLCWDSRNRVDSFLKQHTFAYPTVPDQYRFLTETLSLNGYPTHFVLDKDGRIVKKTQYYREVMYAVKKLSTPQFSKPVN